MLGRRHIHIKKEKLSVHQEKLKHSMAIYKGCYVADGWTQQPLQPSLLHFSLPWLAALPLPSFIQHFSWSDQPPWPQTLQHLGCRAEHLGFFPAPWSPKHPFSTQQRPLPESSVPHLTLLRHICSPPSIEAPQSL